MLGFFYIIPFIAMVGESNFMLFEYAYKPYAILVMLSTLGLPSAISREVSKNLSLKLYGNIRFILSSGTVIMSLLGLLSFGIMYFNKESIALFLVGSGYDQTGNSVEDVVYVLKMISYALLVVPLLSLTRGYVQGFRKMKATAISQLVEQLVRILIILIGTYLVIFKLKLDPVIAVGISTFAAFVSAGAGLVVMLFSLRKNNKDLKETSGRSSGFKIYKNIVKYAIPFIFVGISITLFQAVDTFSINKILFKKGFLLSESELVNALVSMVQKIVVIPVVVATALSASLIPHITHSYYSKNIKEIRENISKSFAMVMLITLPASAGLVVLSKPIFSTIFGTTNAIVGGDILSWYGVVPLFYSVYSVTAAILQGIGKIKVLMFAFVAGLAVKIISNQPLILMYEGVGTAYSTYLGFAVAIFIQMYFIQREAHYRWSENVHLLKKVTNNTVIMTFMLIPFGLYSLNYDSYIVQVVIAIVSITGAIILYAYLTIKDETLKKLAFKKSP